MGRLYILFLMLLLLFPSVAASDTANVTLVSPNDGYLTGSADNITFTCNATDDENVFSISLFHDMGGTFSEESARRIMGVANTTDALLVCGFDSSLQCLDGETPSYSSGTSFESSVIREGVKIDSNDVLSYSYNDNINYDEGTIEVWLRNDVDYLYDYELFFLSVEALGGSELHIWNNYGMLYFDFHDSNGVATSAYANINGWTEEEWHHIAAIWDLDNLVGSGTEVDLFIDGDNSSVSYDGSFSTKSDFYGYGILVGSHYAGYSQTDSLFDEFAIYSRDLTPAEITQSYNNIIGDHSSADANWTLSSLSDGTYVWNCMAYDNESQTSWSSANYTFYVDASTPPSLESFTLDPSSEEDIDPEVNVSITANVTDISNVSHVILQYKSPYAGIYTNDSMDHNNATGLWENGTIVITDENGNWSYRFWSNDTWGTGGVSDVYTLVAEKDHSWSLTVINSSGSQSSNLGSVSGFKGTEKNMGSIMINNTGDYMANFDLTVNLDVSYNVTEPFDIPPGGSKHVEVNITFPETPNEYTILMNMTATSTPSYRTVNGTAISYIGGPYINETTEITDYPLSISQSSGANFTARVKNIGNETASNVTLNWTLPSGWSMTYGNVSESIGDLGPYEKSTVTVTLYASYSATAGAATIWINTTSEEGTGGYDFKTIAVSCTSGDGECGSGCSYASDSDCEAPGGGTTGGDIVGTITVRNPLLGVSAPGRMDLKRGSKYNLTIQVRNDVPNTNLTDITLSIDGYPKNLVEKMPDRIAYVSYGSSETFTLVIDVPPYIEEKLYIVDITVKGNGVYAGGSKAIEYSSKIIFSVQGVDEAESLDAIESAEAALSEMIDSGFSYQSLEGLLADARNSYDKQDFNNAEEIARSIVELKEKAFTISSSLVSLDGEITDAEIYGIKVDDSKKLLSLAKSAFQRGDYKRAESRLEAAVSTYQLETKTLLGLMLFLHKNWHYISLFIIAAVISSLFIKRNMHRRYMRGKLENARERQKSVKKLLENLQGDYYKKRVKTKLEYTTEKRLYEKRIADLVFEETDLERKLSNESLEKKRIHVNEHIKQLQKDYFEKGLMGKSQYSEKLRSLEMEMADIEREMGGRKPGHSKGSAAVMLLIALSILSSGIMAANAAENVTAEDVLSAIDSARSAVMELESNDFGIMRVNRTLQTALNQMSDGEYDSALTNARYVAILRNKAFAVSESLDSAELAIHELSSQGYNTDDAQRLFDQALVEFYDENYEDAETLFGDAMDTLDRIESEAALERAASGNALESLAESIYENKEISAVVLAVAIALAFFVFKAGTGFRRRRKRSAIENYIEDVKKAMKSLQNDYFSRGRISRKDYESRMDEHRKNLQRSLEEITTANTL